MTIIHDAAKHQKSKLPPYGKAWLAERPSAGVVVACGVNAWRFAKSVTFAAMVLPDEAEPDAFHWPSNRKSALIHECGLPDDDRLRSLVVELMRAGAPSVVAIRHSLLHTDPRKFFSQGRADEAA